MLCEEQNTSLHGAIHPGMIGSLAVEKRVGSERNGKMQREQQHLTADIIIIDNI